MIIIKLQGGLGNQMFQYATARAIGNHSIYLDTDFLSAHQSSTEDFTKRDFELAVFKNIKVKTPSSILKCFIKKNLPFFSNYIYQSEKNEIILLKDIKSPNIYLDGYFQNELYFNNVRTELLVDFKFPAISSGNNALMYTIVNDKKSVSIHVRRGDYLKPAISAFHGVLGLDYYELAKEEIESRIGEANYYVFSDDIDWCKSHMIGDNFRFVSNTSSHAWEDMYLMSLCKNNIIANSSYSWWGAWLNLNSNKIVIAPKKWFYEIETEIVPRTWIKI